MYWPSMTLSALPPEGSGVALCWARAIPAAASRATAHARSSAIPTVAGKRIAFLIFHLPFLVPRFPPSVPSRTLHVTIASYSPSSFGAPSNRTFFEIFSAPTSELRRTHLRRGKRCMLVSAKPEPDISRGVCRQEGLSRVLEELLGEGGASDEDA